MEVLRVDRSTARRLDSKMCRRAQLRPSGDVAPPGTRATVVQPCTRPEAAMAFCVRPRTRRRLGRRTRHPDQVAMRCLLRSLGYRSVRPGWCLVLGCSTSSTGARTVG